MSANANNPRVLIGPTPNFSVPDISIGQYLFESAAKYGDKISQVDASTLEGATETYSSIKKRSVRVAIGLKNLNINTDDVVAFCSNNSLDHAVAAVAAFYLGVKVANLEPSLTLNQTKHLISLISPRVIFVQQSAVPLIEESIKDFDTKPELIVIGESDNYQTFKDLDVPQEKEDEFAPTRVDSHGTAVLFFSSGTTGLPKAICQSHQSLLSQVILSIEVGFRDNNFTYSPFYWYTGLLVFLCAFTSGGRRIFSSNINGEHTLKVIEKYKVNVMFMAPILTYNLTRCESASKYDLSSVNYFSLGGTKINRSQLAEVSRLFQNAKILFCYGITEAGLAAYWTYEEENTDTQTVSIGRPTSGVSIKVVDVNTNLLLGPNQNGEILIKSPGLTKGHYRVNAQIYDEEGFYKTGDVGYFDEDGLLFIVERVKEMFKFRSHPVVPSFLEGILMEHPAVKEAVVWGLPQGEEGDAPAACVILKENANVTEEEIALFVSGKVLERDRLVGGITFVKDLPRTPTGKVIRREVKERMLKK